jgi:G3E family GTPase
MADPAPRSDGRLPLTIVGGFLGAGKSTWLRHQLHERRFGRACVLVNEAAETPVDDLLLDRAARVVVLAGGCACCDARDALIAALRGICDAAAGPDGGFDALVLETSGLAEPESVAAAVAADPVLGRRIAVAQVVVLVDARQPLARAQAEAADVFVVAKAAGLDAWARGRLAATLAALAPGARLGWAEFGVPVAAEVDADAPPHDLPAPVARGPISPCRLDVGAGGDWTALSAWLSALLHARGDDVIRVKGVVRAPVGPLLLQSVRRHVQPPEILPERPEGAGEEGIVVLIGRGLDAARLALSWRRFGGG